MKNQSLGILLFLCGLFMSCSLKIPIDKNKLTTDVTIEFVSKNLTINKGDYFLLSENGFKASKNAFFVDRGDPIQNLLKKFRKGDLSYYDVIIRSPNHNSVYYGKITFFNAYKAYQLNAVSRFREISIDSKYFYNATDGRIAMIYEYVEDPNGVLPTWILLMSDEKF
jgi:hypothetical protein